MLCFASSLFKNCLLHNQFLLLTVTTSTIHGLPCGAMIKNPPTDARDTGLIPGSGRSLEWEMATHSSILAWEIPGTEEPGGLQSMGSRRAGHAEQAHTHTHTHTLLMIRGFIPAISAVLTGCIKPYSYSRYITKPCLTLHYLAAARSDQKSKFQNTIPRFSSGEGLWLILVLCACLCVYIFCNEHGLHL